MKMGRKGDRETIGLMRRGRDGGTRRYIKEQWQKADRSLQKADSKNEDRGDESNPPKAPT